MAKVKKEGDRPIMKIAARGIDTQLQRMWRTVGKTRKLRRFFKRDIPI